MGELQVPAGALWGAQTQRAVENFPISGLPMPRGFIRALGADQWARGGRQSRARRCSTRGRGHRHPARPPLEVADGRHDAQFPVDVFQTGSGTSTNMNANEVIARLRRRTRLGTRGAPERPRQHGPEQQRRDPDRDPRQRRAGVSRIAAARARSICADASLRKAGDVGDMVKTGRTHLMDAMPRTLGQELRRWRSAGRERHRAHRRAVVPRLPRWRRAAPRSAPASTRIRSSARRLLRSCRELTGRAVRPERATTSRRWPRRIPRSSCPGS